MKLVSSAVAHKFRLKVSTCNGGFIESSARSLDFPEGTRAKHGSNLLRLNNLSFKNGKLFNLSNLIYSKAKNHYESFRKVLSAVKVKEKTSNVLQHCFNTWEKTN